MSIADTDKPTQAQAEAQTETRDYEIPLGNGATLTITGLPVVQGPERAPEGIADFHGGPAEDNPGYIPYYLGPHGIVRIGWTDDWPDGKPPKNLPPIPVFGYYPSPKPDPHMHGVDSTAWKPYPWGPHPLGARFMFSEVDYSDADTHSIDAHPYGDHWRRLHVGDPVVFKPKSSEGLPKGKHDDELQPVRVSPVDVAKAFEAALPGRSFGFGVSANPKADIKLVLVDGWYLALTEANWAKVLSQAPPRNKYLAERYDCDDFGVWFDGWVSHEYEVNGCAWVLSLSDSHSYNAILVAGDDGKTLHVQLVEPQADREVAVDPKRHHGLQSGMVII